MPGNFKQDDLRTIRTKKALLTALPNLLKKRSFVRITVNDICEEAGLSRAAFYAHFQDKYDLLKYWALSVKPEIIRKDNSYEQTEKSVNDFVNGNKKLIVNILEDANTETLGIVREFIVSLLGLPEAKNASGKYSNKHIVLSTFCAGGMVNFLMWQIKNRFPPELPMMNFYFYKILDLLLIWGAEKKFIPE